MSVINDVARGRRPASPDGLPRRLVMLSPIAEQVLPRVRPALGVEKFHIAASTGSRNALALPVVNGAPIIFAWQPRSPGRTAITRWAPTIAVMLALALGLLAAAMRSSLAALRKFEWLAGHDSLTGLPNRSAFRTELDGRLSERGELAVGMADLDGFKTVNDVHGHPVGDELLRAVAGAYLIAAGTGDFVARLGGDHRAPRPPSRRG